MATISRDALFLQIHSALVSVGVLTSSANSVAAALTQAQQDGQNGHGVSRIASYVAQARSGKVNGQARPRIISQTASVSHIDAQHGFAYPALDLAIDTLIEQTSVSGMHCAGIFNSHHFGVAGWTVERLAQKGLLGLIVGNAPAAMVPWGGNKPLYGTNPIAFACPGPADDPLVIDLSMSEVARGKVMLAAKEGRQVPQGWGFDAQGRPTTDPEAILTGSMAPMGGPKGAALALMVEILSSALIGANPSTQATSFFEAEGAPPGVGQFILAINPGAFGSGFIDRIGNLLAMLETQPGARLPGTTRLKMRSKSLIEVPDAAMAELEQLMTQ